MKHVGYAMQLISMIAFMQCDTCALCTWFTFGLAKDALVFCCQHRFDRKINEVAFDARLWPTDIHTHCEQNKFIVSWIARQTIHFHIIQLLRAYLYKTLKITYYEKKEHENMFRFLLFLFWFWMCLYVCMMGSIQVDASKFRRKKKMRKMLK